MPEMGSRVMAIYLGRKGWSADDDANSTCSYRDDGPRAQGVNARAVRKSALGIPDCVANGARSWILGICPHSGDLAARPQSRRRVG